MTELQEEAAAEELPEISLAINEDDLTLGDLEAMEEVTGPMPDEGIGGLPKSTVTIALALVALRRSDPSATVADARAVKVSQLKGAEDEEEPASDVGPTD